MAFQWDKIKNDAVGISVIEKGGQGIVLFVPALIVLFGLIILKSWPSVGIYFSKQ